MMNNMIRVTFASVLVLLSAAALPQADNARMQSLMKKLEMLNAMDFQNSLEAAESCTRKRDFSCSRKKLKEAERWASSSKQELRLTLVKEDLESEEKLVALEKEERALKEKLRRERIAEEKRQREWQQEQRRQRELAERRAREKREKQRAASIGLGLLAGAAAVYNGADSELGTQVMEQTATGLYANMSGDQDAARQYQSLTAGMEQNLEQFKVRQQALRQEQEARRRQHEAIIKRHEENMRASQRKPVYVVQAQANGQARSQRTNPVRDGSSESKVYSVNDTSGKGTRYVLHNMEGIDPVPVRVTPRYKAGPSYVVGGETAGGSRASGGGGGGRGEDANSADYSSSSSEVSGVEDSTYPDKARARKLGNSAMHCVSAMPHDKDENKWVIKNSCSEKVVAYICGTMRWTKRRCGDSEDGNFYTNFENLEPLQTIEKDMDHDDKPSYLRYAACMGSAYSGDYIIHKKEDNGKFTCLYKKHN